MVSSVQDQEERHKAGSWEDTKSNNKRQTDSAGTAGYQAGKRSLGRSQYGMKKILCMGERVLEQCLVLMVRDAHEDAIVNGIKRFVKPIEQSD